MISNLRFLAKQLTRQSYYLPNMSRNNVFNNNLTITLFNNMPKPLQPVVDIDWERDDMMYEDNGEHKHSLLPLDMDDWSDDAEVKQDCIDSNVCDPVAFEFPTAPEKRMNVTEFKGFKLMMTPRMFHNSTTYRWRVDPEDHAAPSDDMSICRFEPKETILM